MRIPLLLLLVFSSTVRSNRDECPEQCDDDSLCYRANASIEGICVKACVKLQCRWTRTKSQRTFCECAHRRVPCHLDVEHSCASKSEPRKQTKSELIWYSDQRVTTTIDCSNVTCSHSTRSTTCPADSSWLADPLSPDCCGRCVCSTCPKTICGENSIIEISRTGNPNRPGHCCDKFQCITSR